MVGIEFIVVTDSWLNPFVPILEWNDQTFIQHQGGSYLY